MRLFVTAVLLLVLLWVAIPAARAVALVETFPIRPTPRAPAGLPTQDAEFPAADGTLLRGWIVPGRLHAPTVVLIPGFKADRTSMIPYARFLHRAGYNVLLYDSRGTGASQGQFSLGLREVEDVEGAVGYLERIPTLPTHRYALLGVSLGAGVALVAAVHLPAVDAVIADSPYTDQRYTVNRLDTLHLAGLTVPLAPLGPWLVDQLISGHLSQFDPLAAMPLLHRPTLLIHSRHDTNPTTPLSAAYRLQRAGRPFTTLWIAPRGGHAGALLAQPAAYESHVLHLLRRAFGT